EYSESSEYSDSIEYSDDDYEEIVTKKYGRRGSVREVDIRRNRPGRRQMMRTSRSTSRSPIRSTSRSPRRSSRQYYSSELDREFGYDDEIDIYEDDTEYVNGRKVSETETFERLSPRGKRVMRRNRERSRRGF
ncbi:MAG: hypothetical protein GY751_11045, partial [Bacteroidetes bacterium]|nr:hypothetical protein [Bacteroidota bacterium]